MKNFLIVFLLCSINLMASIYVVDEQYQLPNTSEQLYIDLIKKVIANTIYEDSHQWGTYDPNLRQNGLDFPLVAHTMIGMKRLNNLQYCVEQVLVNKVPGDLIETGVWRGGATILMRAILQAYQCKDRRVWVADSFEGLPPPNSDKYPSDQGVNLHEVPFLAISLEKVQDNFRKYGLLDNQVVFLKGFFSETLPTAPIEKIAVLRLDGDLYESTMDALVNLYPKLSIGGFIIIDDFGLYFCRQAVADYREAHGIDDPIQQIDESSVFWQKTQ